MAAKRSLTLRCRLFLSLRYRSPEVSDCSPANRKRKLGFDRQETDLFTLLILLDSRGQVCGALWPALVQHICVPTFFAYYVDTPVFLGKYGPVYLHTPVFVGDFGRWCRHNYMFNPSFSRFDPINVSLYATIGDMVPAMGPI